MASIVCPPPCNSSSPSPSSSAHSPALGTQRASRTQTTTSFGGDNEKGTKSNTSVRARLSQLCKDGRLEAANHLFDSITKPHTVLWNTMIVGFICNGFPDEGLRFYRRMKQNSGRKPDVYTYSSALKACSDLRDLRAGKAIHCHVIRSRLKPTTILCNSLLNLYAHCLSCSFVYQSFDEFLHGNERFTENGDVGSPQINGDVLEKRVSLNGLVELTCAVTDDVHQQLDTISQGERSNLRTGAETGYGSVGVDQWVRGRTEESLARKMRENMVDQTLGGIPRGDLAEIGNISPKVTRRSVVNLLFDRMPRRNVVSWNIMISWYFRTGRPFEAVKNFMLMLERGVRGTVLSFVNVFPAVAQLCEQQASAAFHGLLLKSGPSYAYDPFAVSSLICLYFGISDPDSARRVFDSVTERNTEIWNSMISGYIQNDYPDEALEFFLQLLVSEQRPDAVTVLGAVMAVSQLQQSEFCPQIHAYALKASAGLPLIVSNALLAMYSRCNCLDIACDFFSKMINKDLVSWNTMVSAFVQNGLNLEAIKLIHQMQKLGLVFDSVTVTLLASLCSNLGDPRMAMQTHAYMFRHGIYFEGMEGYLVDMYVKSGHVETARKVFQRVKTKDQVLWNAMTAGYTQNGLSSEAFKTFQEMLEQKQRPNSVTLASILPACNASSAVSRGKELHCFAIHRALDNNVFVDTALVDMYAKCGLVASAVNVFNRMQERNSVSYTTMISCYGLHGRGQNALELFQEMLGAGMKPDHVTILAVLSACSQSGLVEEGLRIFHSISDDFGIIPSFEHCCCVVDMLGKAGMVEEAYGFLRGMEEKVSNTKLWGTLLNACRIHGRFKLGNLVADRLFQMENGIPSYHVLLSHIYAAEGRWDSVDNVRKAMREMGLRKETGKSWIDVCRVVYCFTARDQNHQQQEEIHTMLDMLLQNMKAEGYEPVVDHLTDDILAVECG
ncbi:Pentatricopeptide repeat-containing protein [Nymphaea thermarum]|nr:Pentatricopeptide repeat-containing protein [Nymphaea thermarum]